MCSTVLAQRRAAHQRLRTAAWLSVVSLVSTAWGCRVKRLDQSGPAPSASAAAPAPSNSVRSLAAGKAPAAQRRAAKAAPASSHAATAPHTVPRTAGSADPNPPSTAPELAAFAATELPAGVAAVAFSGPGTDPTQTQGLVSAVRHALRALTTQSPPLEAAVAGTTIVEDDPSLNAGTGAALRLDGSAELEVLVMDSSGRMGAAAAVRNVQHPVRLAFAAASSPHRMLVGEGAQRVAQWLGLPAYDPRTARQKETHESLVARFAPGHSLRADATAWGSTTPGPGAHAWQAYLEPPQPEPPPVPPDAGVAAVPPAPEAPPAETSVVAVAVLVRAGPGAFAAAIETGGAWLALPGSVGAIATPGAALYVAGRGAVALSGPSERLITGALARRTYDKLLAFQSARAAATWALEQAEERPISIVVMDARNIVTLSNAPTAWAKADPNETNSAASAAEARSR